MTAACFSCSVLSQFRAIMQLFESRSDKSFANTTQEAVPAESYIVPSALLHWEFILKIAQKGCLAGRDMEGKKILPLKFAPAFE